MVSSGSLTVVQIGIHHHALIPMVIEIYGRRQCIGNVELRGLYDSFEIHTQQSKSCRYFLTRRLQRFQLSIRGEKNLQP